MKAKDLTYMGRRARAILIGSKGLGRRVNVLEWVDDATEENGGHKAGTVVATHLKGDGRIRTGKDAVVVYGQEVFDNLSDALTWAEERLR